MVILSQLSLSILVFFTGATLGSFLNVVAYRLPRGMDFVSGRSQCPQCHIQLGPQDLVPLFSYLFLRGRCRNCGGRISLRYPLVEACTGLLFVLVVWVLGPTILAGITCLFTALLVVITLIDADTMTIPDGLVLAVGVLVIPFWLVQEGISPLERLIGFFAVSLPMLLLALAIEGAFGGGDIKLMAVCGLILGVKNLVFATFVAILLGGFYSIYLLASKKSQAGAQIPFGPYLCVGCYLSCLWGTPLVAAYLGQF